VIISASYRTVIPAFYAEWLFARLAAGYCTVRNPYSGRPYHVDLRPMSVDGFVFWTRNFGPVLRRVEELLAYGRPAVVQYTITNYPRAIEPAVIEASRAVDQMHEIARAMGRRAAAWRYDPILFTSLTPPEFHIENFAQLARQLEGATDEAVISFAQIYRKSERNLNAAAASNGFSGLDEEAAGKRALLARLGSEAGRHGMRLSVCTQPEFAIHGAVEARCVDARRLSDLGGRPCTAPTKGNRPGCLCHESRDIGDYDTCPHGCVYCYANQHRRLAQRRYHAHDAAGEAGLVEGRVLAQ
jgi:hypothetical protein